MSRSHRSPHTSDDAACQRLTALTERLTANPPPDSGAAASSAAEPSPDSPLIGSIPAPPYAHGFSGQRASHCGPGPPEADGPSAVPPAESRPLADFPRSAPAEDDTTPDSDDEPSGAKGNGGPGLRPPPGYVEVGDDLTRRSWLAALRGRLPRALTEQPRLSRSGLHALVAVCSVAVIAASWFFLQARPSPEPAPELSADSGESAVAEPSGAQPAPPGDPPASPQPTGEVMVHVDGGVDDPGVVTLPAGARVADAIEAAGGVDSGTDTEPLNLARPLTDGEQVLVGVTPPPGSSGAGAPAPGGAPEQPDPLVDLNTASPEQLEELPGVGPVLAERIVEHRTTNGGFTSVEELHDVNGIGEVRFAELSDLVRVNGAG